LQNDQKPKYRLKAKYALIKHLQHLKSRHGTVENAKLTKYLLNMNWKTKMKTKINILDNSYVKFYG